MPTLFMIAHCFLIMQVHWKTYYFNLINLSFQSFGVVYGDLSTSPLYVYKSAFSGKLYQFQDEETVFGLFSLIFWTLTLIPLLKYVIVVLSADDNGEGMSLRYLNSLFVCLFDLYLQFCNCS